MIDALADRYTVTRELGRGGMATVYLADDLRHRRQVAIKVLRPELGVLLGPDRFAREIRIAAGLNHPHILPLHDSGGAGRATAALLYYVMPYVAGRVAAAPARPRAPAPRRRGGPASYGRSPPRWTTPTRRAWSTATSSRRTSCCTRARRWSPTSASRSRPRRRAGRAAHRDRAPDRHAGLHEPRAGDRRARARCAERRVQPRLRALRAAGGRAAAHRAPSARGVIARRFTEPAPARAPRLRPPVPAAMDQALVQALAGIPAERFPTAAAFAEALAGTLAARAPRPPVGRGAPVPQPERRPGERVLRRRDHRGRDRPALEDPLAQGHRAGSVMKFKTRDQTLREIGATLDVATLLEGSVRRAGTACGSSPSSSTPRPTGTSGPRPTTAT